MEAGPSVTICRGAVSCEIRMPHKRPLISVIPPAYNSERTLARAHASLLLQGVEWQHVIVNDGSTDGTAGLIDALAQDPRVLGVHRPNGGPGAALNTGLDCAECDLVAFLDADDEYRPDHLEARLAALTATGADVLWGGVEVIAERPEDHLTPDVEKGFGFIPIAQCIVQGTLFGKRAVFEALRFSEDRTVWWQDYDIIQRARAKYRVEHFDLPTYRYYRGYGFSLTDSVRANWPARPAASAAGASML